MALFLLLINVVAGQTLKIATTEDIERDLKLVPCKSSDRLAAVQELFRSVGAEDSDMAVIDHKRTKNVVVTKKGVSDEKIIVGAHYDKVDAGCGAIDNWTGIVAIVHLYGTLRNMTTEKTIQFVAFDQEENGLVGSGAFVKDISRDQRSNYCAMINIDSLGFTDPWIMDNTSERKLIAAAKSFWKQMKLDIVSTPILKADADSSSFINAGIPAMTFVGLDASWQQYLHSTNDKLKNVKSQSVFSGYRLILPFIVKVDSQPCDAFRKK